MPVAPVRLNHAVLFVADLERSLRFYTETLSLETVTTEPRVPARRPEPGLPRVDQLHPARADRSSLTFAL